MNNNVKQSMNCPSCHKIIWAYKLNHFKCDDCNKEYVLESFIKEKNSTTLNFVELTNLNKD